MASKLGAFIHKARQNLGLSLRAAESQTGISNAYISQIESGKIKEPSPFMLAKFADAYGVSYLDLMGLAGYRVPDHSTEIKSLLAQNQALQEKIKDAAETLKHGALSG